MTATNAKNETTTYGYDLDGYLTTITRPMTGATTTYGYDDYGRIDGVTEPDGYAIATQYDTLDRPTRITYPDTTYEEITYDKLDAATRRDRLGRVTRTFYDALRRMSAVRDPLGRTITQQWCSCGSLDKLIDAKGQATTWERDVQGRVTREVRADSTTDTLYAYETTTSRLRTVTDPKDQVTTYQYAADDRVLSLTFTNATVPTPTVNYAYDPNYPRLATMVDGIGTTTYTYKAPLTLGAGQVATVDGPLTNDTIAFGYDDLGRTVSRLVNGFGISSVTYDPLGRLTQDQNVLGTFAYTYDGLTNRPASLTYPNGQTSSYMYFGHSGDHRLQTIHHKDSATATLSKFDYTYDAIGSIQTWRQQAGVSAVMWNYGYDTAEQLTLAVKKNTDPTPVVLKRYAYTYDPAGNRTAEQIDDAVMGASYNSLNRLTSQQPSGILRVAGTLNEPATVTIQGKSATVTADNKFEGTALIASGTNTFTVVATDPNNNVKTNTYEVSSAGSTKTFAYDANGNLTGDGTRTFEWDARNQLVAVNVGTHRSEFTYDGFQRLVRIVEKESSAVQSDTKVVWCETEICEERASDGTTVTRRPFALGEQVSGVARYFSADHLGSVTEVTNTSEAVLARYAFDPLGRRSLTSGSDINNIGFTGHRWHDASGVWLSWYRAYEPVLGRWVTEDPARFAGGMNLYVYGESDPVNVMDPTGLVAVNVSPPAVHVVPTSQVPGGGCGALVAKGSFAGNCSCEPDGGWKASLSITYKADIYVANDRWRSWQSFLRHEMKHHADNMAAIDRAKRSGEAIEARRFATKQLCEARVKQWQDASRADAGRSAKARDFLGLNALFCF